MEILYPDVIGSGGAPKRIMKPKRKGPDVIQSDDPDMPGTGVLDLHVESPFRPPSQPGLVAHQQQQQQQQQQQVQQQQQRQSFASPVNMQQRQMSMTQQRPTSTAMPPRTHIAGTSALTPPEETATHNRRRFPGNHGAQHAAVSGDVNKAPTATMGPPSTNAAHPEKRRRVSSYNAASGSSAPSANAIAAAASSTSAAPADAAMVAAGKQVMEDSILSIAEALKARTPPRWPEQAMDIFFRDFADEDMDLQIKIAEKALADENKAMVFCKMPAVLRKHWVKRLREVHNNRVA